jgi:hypothetical protein
MAFVEMIAWEFNATHTAMIKADGSETKYNYEWFWRRCSQQQMKGKARVVNSKEGRKSLSRQ